MLFRVGALPLPLAGEGWGGGAAASRTVRVERAPTQPPPQAGEVKQDGSAQFSTLIRASRITGPHLSISDFRKAASSPGVVPRGVAPRSSKRGLTDGCASAALVSALSLAMISGGVFAGTKKPNLETSKPGTPAS